MANVNTKIEELIEQLSFRYIQNIDAYSDIQLKEYGYYRGFVCPHGHTIRDLDNHWCYECTKRIKSNICGFDINYLHTQYKTKYAALWKRIEIGHPEDCWTIKSFAKATQKRVCMPSYRSFYSKNLSENVTIPKALYQCAWGDVGAMSVTRLCGNNDCGNPLHMISTWNRGMPPKDVSPFDIEFKAEKLMLYARGMNTNQNIEDAVKKQYKNTITHPLEANDPPDYDEG
ncbi:MAG: hypothetical protein EBS53_02125 [Bacteroidetes bacterium]|nr:hypothetical protein [Bacteroidota bacterium]